MKMDKTNIIQHHVCKFSSALKIRLAKNLADEKLYGGMFPNLQYCSSYS